MRGVRREQCVLDMGVFYIRYLSDHPLHTEYLNYLQSGKYIRGIDQRMDE